MIAYVFSAEEKVGCFVVGLSVLRNDLESHNRSYWLKLTSSLKDSIVEDLQKLQQHVDTTTLTLNRPTLTLEEIGSIDTAYSNILEQQSSVECTAGVPIAVITGIFVDGKNVRRDDEESPDPFELDEGENRLGQPAGNSLGTPTHFASQP